MHAKQIKEGWIFINQIVLQRYHSLYIELKKKLLKSLSVNGVIQLMIDVKKIGINKK